MIKKTTCALAFILVIISFAACGQKEAPQAQTEQAQPAAQSQTPNLGEMVLIPAGEYLIGTNDKDPADPAKKMFTPAYPEHKVKLPAFWIDKYEVTGKEYLDFSAKTQYQPEGESEGKTWRTFFSIDKAYVPVTSITWKDADAYCKAAGERLPTEEEWEAAARGPNGYRFPWGNTWEPNKANTSDAGYGRPVDVGKFDDVSPLGVHDMFGNVQEWTASWYKPYPGNTQAGLQKFDSSWRVIRGMASRYSNVSSSGLWARTAYLPNYVADFGCRCAKDATKEEADKAAPAK